ncbi:MAG: helix-turn-helix transcriptional regulator [Bacteroidetes bacterium]|nr:helix-turn-helix transcriptional regulator [Bacteroidota bacterium]
MFDSKSTYGDFLQSEEKIATNILADRLSMLEWAEMIVKEEHPENKTKFVYKPTQKAIDLVPVFLELIVWSDKHEKISVRAKQFAKQIRKDKDAVIKQLSVHLKSLMKK